MVLKLKTQKGFVLLFLLKPKNGENPADDFVMFDTKISGNENDPSSKTVEREKKTQMGFSFL